MMELFQMILASLVILVTPVCDRPPLWLVSGALEMPLT